MLEYKVILGLGSNMGERRAHLQAAISTLAQCVKNIRCSQIFESAALLPENAPTTWDMKFLNMAIAGVTTLPPRDLLLAVQQIEQNLGRNKVGHWCPRPIDIDILAMWNSDGDVLINEPDLIIPHAELLKRDFALIPLAEIAPDWVHPLVKKTARELADSMQSSIHQLPSTKLVGIVNVTPDSFSDGGNNFSPQNAIDYIGQLIADGSDIIDIGAESTRPNATPITPEEEWARLAPILALRNHLPIAISIDTRHGETAKKALAAGADWINDVSGFSSPEMIAAVKDSDCKLVMMHSLSVPADKSLVLPEDCDVVAEILAWAETKIKELEAVGIIRERLIFDVGIGFGKTAEQSQKLIGEIAKFKILGVKLLVGHSRKSFLGAKNLTESDKKTLEISKFLAANGVDYLRVHNVKIHKEAGL